jgi:predicted DNA-binding transcriptional regulator AlpA
MDGKRAYSVSEFCEAHGLGRATFYQLLKDRKRAPRIIKVGSRTLISVESAAEWRARMERLAEETITAAV